MRWFLLFLFIILLQGCISTAREEPQLAEPSFTIETISASCSDGETKVPEVEAGQGRVTAIVEIETPTPCYNTTGEVEVSEGRIEINLKPVATDRMCVECIGKLVVRVTVENLSSGSYEVAIAVPKESWVFNIEVE